MKLVLSHTPPSRAARAEGSVAPGFAKAASPAPGGADRNEEVRLVLALSEEQRAALAAEGVDVPEDAHVTLAHFGSGLGAHKVALIARVVRAVAAHLAPVAGRTNGFGRFQGAPSDVIYLNYDSPDLPALRAALLRALNAVGVIERRDHGFTPHITLAQLDESDPTPELRADVFLEFDALELWVGGARTRVPLNPLAPLATLSAFVTKAVSQGALFDHLPHPIRDNPNLEKKVIVDRRGRKQTKYVRKPKASPPADPWARPVARPATQTGLFDAPLDAPPAAADSGAKVQRKRVGLEKRGEGYRSLFVASDPRMPKEGEVVESGGETYLCTGHGKVFYNTNDNVYSAWNLDPSEDYLQYAYFKPYSEKAARTREEAEAYAKLKSDAKRAKEARDKRAWETKCRAFWTPLVEAAEKAGIDLVSSSFIEGRRGMWPEKERVQVLFFKGDKRVGIAAITSEYSSRKVVWTEPLEGVKGAKAINEALEALVPSYIYLQDVSIHANPAEERRKREAAELIDKFTLFLAPHKGEDAFGVGSKKPPTAQQWAKITAHREAILAVLRERKALRDTERAEEAAIAALRRYEEEREDRERVESAKAGLPALIAQIPEDGVRLEVRSVTQDDGQPVKAYFVGDTRVPDEEVTVVGTVSATRPKATAPYWEETVAYVPKARLEALWGEAEAERAEKAAFDQRVAALEVSAPEEFVEGDKRGRRYAIRRGDEVYVYELGQRDLSNGDAPYDPDNWVSYEHFTRDGERVTDEGLKRELYAAAVRNPPTPGLSVPKPAPRYTPRFEPRTDGGYRALIPDDDPPYKVGDEVTVAGKTLVMEGTGKVFQLDRYKQHQLGLATPYVRYGYFKVKGETPKSIFQQTQKGWRTLVSAKGEPYQAGSTVTLNNGTELVFDGYGTTFELEDWQAKKFNVEGSKGRYAYFKVAPKPPPAPEPEPEPDPETLRLQGELRAAEDELKDAQEDAQTRFKNLEAAKDRFYNALDVIDEDDYWKRYSDPAAYPEVKKLEAEKRQAEAAWEEVRQARDSLTARVAQLKAQLGLAASADRTKP